MRPSRWRGHRTGFGTFVLGTGMGLITNLITGNVDRWPALVRPVATYSPAIGASLLIAVGAKATWDKWRTGISRPEWTGDNPYPGLAAYTEQWAGVYFGRSTEIRELVARVRHARTVTGRFVPVVGPSGSGKSSLVLAGLLPALGSGSGLRTLPVFSPGTNAVGELAGVLGTDLTAPSRSALAAARAGDPAPRPDGVLAALSRLRAGARGLLLVIDQLEETVTQCVEEDRHAFLALLEAMLAHEPRLRIVATVRSDTIGTFQDGPGSGLFHDPLMVNVLGAREIRLIVGEPARLTATTFDDGLVDEIVFDAGGGDVLPLLSYLLSELYHHAGRDRRITWREYQNSGGVSGAINRQAQAVVRGLDRPDSLRLCLDTLLLFVTLGPGGATRQPVRASVLDTDQLRVVHAFVDARLLISDSGDRADDRDTVYTIAHEALLRQWQPLSEHIVRHEENLRRLTELAPMARAWQQSGRRADYLITGVRLTEALDWARSARTASPQIREFLDESHRNQTGELDRRANRAARDALASLATAPQFGTALAVAAYTELAPTELAAYALEAAVAPGLLRLTNHPAGVTAVAFNAAGRLTAATEDGVVYVWADTGPACQQFPAHAQGAVAVAYGPDGRLATAAGDGTVRVWHASGQQAGTWRAAHAVRLAYTTDGRLAVGTLDGTVQLVDARSAPAGELTDGVPDGPVYALAADTTGRLAAGSGGGTVLIWDGDGHLTHRLTGHRDAVLALAFGPHGSLASAGRDGQVIVWDRAGSITSRPAGARGTVNALAYRPDGFLAAGLVDGSVCVWAPDGRLVHLFTDRTNPVGGVAFAADGRLAAGTRDGAVRVWDLHSRLTVTVATGPTTALAFGPDAMLAVGSADGLSWWNSTGVRATVPFGPARAVRAIAVAGDGRLAAGHDDHRIRVWGPLPRPGKCLLLAGHEKPVTALAFTPDGLLISGARDGSVRWWEQDGSCRGEVSCGGWVFGLVAQADGGIVVHTGNRLIRIGAQGSESDVLPGFRSDMSALSGTGDGRLAVGFTDGTVRMTRPDGASWNLDSPHTECVTACSFAPDGRLATGTVNGEVCIWDPTGRRLHTIPDQAGGVTALTFAPDGRLAVACDTVVRVWPCGTDPRTLLTLAARHRREPLTARQRETAMLPVARDGGD